jgi:hypothetical protein
MRKKSNKIFVIMSIIMSIIILLVGGTFYVIYNLLFYPKVSSRMDEFSLYIKEYTEVAKLCYEDFGEYDADLLSYSVLSNNNDDKDLVCFTEGFKHEITIGENEHKSLLKICESYGLDQQSLYYINVYSGFISFCNENGRASYVYSIYDEKPMYISKPIQLEKKNYVKKMCDNWYFVSKTS